MRSKNVNTDYVDLPIDICSFAIKEKKYLPLKLFLYWKLTSSGHLRADANSMIETARSLNYKSKGQVYVARKWLLENGWITFNGNRNSIRLRRFDQIKKQYKFTSTVAAHIEMKDLMSLNGFLAAAVITYWGKFYTGKRGQSAPDLIKKGSSRKSDRAPDSHFICPNKLIMGKLSLPLSSASQLRRSAQKAGYLKLTRDYEKLPFNVNEAELLRKYADNSNRIRVRNNMLYEEKPSLIWSTIKLYKIWTKKNKSSFP
jgi:hypothetical protein